jgi:short-subunit dehydrogenase
MHQSYGPVRVRLEVALPPPGPTTTCLVTGASSGIGADIARELAKRGLGLTLVARREDRLRTLADELAATGVRVEVIAADVADPDGRAKMVDTINRAGLDVEVLINNAGYGSGGAFHELSVDSEVAMVRINCEAVVALTHEYLPKMIERGRGAVLNVGSTAGEQPLPRQATYSATKAFVNTFSDALNAETHGTGVTVTSLRPGPVKTEFGDVAGISDELFSAPDFTIKSSEDVAKAAVHGLEHGKRTVAPGVAAKFATVGGRVMPRTLLLPILRRQYPVGK